MKNVRYFLGIVKRATGNQRDPDAESEKKGTGKTKPGKIVVTPVQRYVEYFAANAITRVILSSGQGPGIQISDI